MIDKIINFNGTEELAKELEREVIELQNPRYIFLFAYYNLYANIDLLEKALINTDSVRYIQFFLRQIKTVNTELLIDKLIALKDGKSLYYVSSDKKDLNESLMIKILIALIKLNDKKYTLYFYYNYFCIQKRFNSIVVDLLNKTLSNLSIDIKLDNQEEIIEFIDNYYKKIKEDIVKRDEYSNNCYKGHNDLIPEYIVCHICSDAGKAINQFYDPKTEVSAHYVISKEGIITQVVSLDDSAWANGTSMNEESDVYYKFAEHEYVKNTKINANYFTFSIEHESFDGELTEEQFKSSIKVMKEIIGYLKERYNYDFIIDEEHITGHKALNPIVRPNCPGINFPFERIIKELKR